MFGIVVALKSVNINLHISYNLYLVNGHKIHCYLLIAITLSQYLQKIKRY